MSIVFIHGAYSTYRSFSFMAEKFSDHQHHYVEYSVDTPIEKTIAAAQQMVDECSPVAVIGHSYGGIVAAHVKTEAKRIAIASPLGGLRIMIPFNQLVCDVSVFSRHITELSGIDHKNFESIVACGNKGSGFDGVLPVWTQEALSIPKHHFNLNHFEILLDREVIETAKSIIYR